VLGLFVVNLLPVDVTGLILMALGVVMLVAEAFIPAFGVLGLGGLAALALGDAIAFDFEVSGFRLSPWMIGWSATLGGVLLLATIRAVWRTRRRPVLTGGQGMIGAQRRVLSWSGSAGVVLVHGERWAAAAAGSALTSGQQVGGSEPARPAARGHGRSGSRESTGITIRDFTGGAAYLNPFVAALTLLWVSVWVLREYERGVVFTLGRFSGVRGPRLILLIPFVQQTQRVDLRTVMMDVPSEDVISRDNVSVKVTRCATASRHARCSGPPGRGVVRRRTLVGSPRSARHADEQQRRPGPDHEAVGVLSAPAPPSTFHPCGWYMEVDGMAGNVHEFRPKGGDSEKITINLGYVDLGHIDLLVQEGFYANRTDLIRTAIRNQVERHAEAARRSMARKSLDVGLRHFSREDLEAMRATGRMLDIRVLGLASIAADVTPDLARATIASVTVLGALQASAAVKAALADRTH
jgi:Arc/MetJ-type ribon-helix-helix transcriptional regulator/membrane protein implicated in regulation of membrane protease activity